MIVDLNKPGAIVLCKNMYPSEDAFWKAHADLVRLLIEAEYIVVTHYEEKAIGTLIIEFCYDDASMGTAMPVWLDEKERDALLA